MALAETTDLKLGFEAPNFNLPDTVSGKNLGLNDVAGEKGTLVMFICNHCPYVVHVIHKLIELGGKYSTKGVGMVAISSNDAENYPDDGPGKMKDKAEELAFPFPYLYDETQEVAKSYDAACTPDFALFDENRRCVYRGRLDGSTPGNGVPVSGADLEEAIQRVIRKEPQSKIQHPSMGCNIKWK